MERYNVGGRSKKEGRDRDEEEREEKNGMERRGEL
jgi:hypothetical protein